jgi:diacylglycerol kinase family enzyme
MAEEQKSKETTITLPSPDGRFEAIVRLAADQDSTKPPRLLSVSKRPLDKPSPNRTSDRLETHIIISVGSGAQQAEQFYEHVVFPILTILYDAEHVKKMIKYTTQSATSVLDYTNQTLFPLANGDDPKALRIILLSGDGGVVDLVNGLLSKPTKPSYIPPQVVLLPLGTANALYHSINTSKENIWGLNALSSTTAKPLPTFTATFSPGSRLLVDEARKEEHLPTDTQGTHILHGAVVCSWGMHASLVGDSDTTEYRKFGIDRFKMAAKEALYPADGSSPHPYKGKVSVLKSDNWSALPGEEHMYILATMVSNLEQPFCISPESRPLDGSMHLVHFGPRSGDDVMRVMNMAYQGGLHVKEDDVRYESIDGMRVEFQGREKEGRWRRVCVDGKIVRVEEEGWVEVRKEERRVLDVIVA